MVVQALWENKSPLLQLPHINEPMLRHFVTKRVCGHSSLSFWIYVNVFNVCGAKVEDEFALKGCETIFKMLDVLIFGREIFAVSGSLLA